MRSSMMLDAPFIFSLRSVVQICLMTRKKPANGYRNKKDWSWRIPFRTEATPIPEDMSDKQIIEILNAQYTQLMKFQEKLVQAMSESGSELGGQVPANGHGV